MQRKDKRTVKKNTETAQRARTLARTLAGRIYVSHDGLFLVNGMPKTDDLSEGINKVQELLDERWVTPQELGFSSSQCILVNRDSLSERGRALQKWHKMLKANRKPNQKVATRREKFNQWENEVKNLTLNLERLWELLRQWENDPKAFESPFFLNTEQTVKAPTGLLYPTPDCPRLIHLISWLSGTSTAQRFLDAIRPIMLTPQQQAKYQRFQRFYDLFVQYKDEKMINLIFDTEDGAKRPLNSLFFSRLIDSFGYLEPDIYEVVTSVLDLTLTIRGLSSYFKVDDLHYKIRYAIYLCLPDSEKLKSIPYVATLVVSDKSTEPIPVCLLNSYYCVELREYYDHKAYDALLRLLKTHPKLLSQITDLRVPSFQHNSSWVGNAQQHVSCCNFVLQPAIC